MSEIRFKKVVEWQARLRFLSLGTMVVALIVWAFNFAPFDDLVDHSGTPIGADYPVFYLAGRMVLDGRVDELYSHEAQQRRLHVLFPTLDAGDWLPFRYPPFVAAAMAPLAALPYVASWLTFTGLSLAALALAWRSLTSQLPKMSDASRRLSLLLLLGWPVTFETLLGGQSSLFSLAILCATTALVNAKRFTTGGTVLALAAFKPNILAVFALGYVCRYPRLLRGAIPVGLIFIATSWLTIGTGGCDAYLRLGAQLASQPWEFETAALKVHGLAAWLTPILAGYERPALLLSGIAATAALVFAWRRRGDDLRTNHAATALLISVNFLANPYVPIYDIAILAACWYFLFAVESDTADVAQSRELKISGLVGVLLYVGPHLSQLLTSCGLPQCFTLGWVAVTVWQWQRFRAALRLGRVSLEPDWPEPSRFGGLTPPHAARA